MRKAHLFSSVIIMRMSLCIIVALNHNHIMRELTRFVLQFLENVGKQSTGPLSQVE